MQASHAGVQASRTALTRDLYAVVVHVMKAGTSEVFRLVGDLDMSLTQIKVLHLLDAADEEVSVTFLAEKLGVSMPAMSRSIDGLLHRGFVERREDEEDRRMKRVRITDAGRAVPHALEDARLTALHAFMESLDDGEVERLAVALEPIAAREDIARCRPEKDRV